MEKSRHQAVQCDLGGSVTAGTTEAHPIELSLVGVVDSPSPEMGSTGVEALKADGNSQTEERILLIETTEAQLFHGWTVEQLREAQIADPDITPIRKWLEQGTERPSWAEISPHSPATKTYWSQWKRLYFKEGILVRRFHCAEETIFYPQIILPRMYQSDVLKQMHDGPVGGHFGVDRTLTRLQTRYYWYRMREDVTLWCRTCTSCAARARPSKTPQAPMGTVRVGAPMERVALDIMGPLNETDRHNRYVLVVQDYFSKWVEAYPLPDEQAVTVAEVFTSEWVCRFGAPQTLHSDQGTNFESQVFQKMCELLGIEKTRTTSFRPQSDGQVERFNATLQNILATTAERCHWDWDIMIPYAVMAYRATKHSSTGFTPNMMLFGREVTEPIDLVAGLPPGHESAQTPPQYVTQLRERLELAHQITRDALGQSVERAKKQYDKNVCRTLYHTGDAVWHLVKGTKRVRDKVRKFLPSYEGPYFVLGQLDDLVYRIKKGPKAKVKVVHHDKLKPYHSRTLLDNVWVIEQAQVWNPAEVLPPIPDTSLIDSDLFLANLFPDTAAGSDSGQEAESSTDIPLSPVAFPSSPHTAQVSSSTEEVHASGGSAVQRTQKATVMDSTQCQTSRGRSSRTRRPPDTYGEWVTY